MPRGSSCAPDGSSPMTSAAPDAQSEAEGVLAALHTPAATRRGFQSLSRRAAWGGCRFALAAYLVRSGRLGPSKKRGLSFWGRGAAARGRRGAWDRGAAARARRGGMARVTCPMACPCDGARAAPDGRVRVQLQAG